MSKFTGTGRKSFEVYVDLSKWEKVTPPRISVRIQGLRAEQSEISSSAIAPTVSSAATLTQTHIASYAKE